MQKRFERALKRAKDKGHFLRLLFRGISKCTVTTILTMHGMEEGC
jgi:hypothetical protein